MGERDNYLPARIGMASNGLKIACAINAKSPRNGRQGLAMAKGWQAIGARAYAIGTKKPGAMAGLCCFVYVSLKD